MGLPAHEFFEGNLRLLGPIPEIQSQADPERYNLYHGLIAMAKELEAQRRELHELRSLLRKLER